MSPIQQTLLTVVGAVLASSGFWAYFQNRLNKNTVHSNMLIGLAHDRIMYLGMSYIERGWLTRDEYENIYNYLYEPYERMGGNGSAQRIMDEVKKLKICSNYSTALTKEVDCEDIKQDVR